MSDERCTEHDYVQAAGALCAAMDAHAKVTKYAGSSAYRAVLGVTEFHDRCLELARSIAAERFLRERREQSKRERDRWLETQERKAGRA